MVSSFRDSIYRSVQKVRKEGRENVAPFELGYSANQRNLKSDFFSSGAFSLFSQSIILWSLAFALMSPFGARYSDNLGN